MITFDRAEVVVPDGDGTATILQSTSLTLAEGCISVIGANGSGKSTLARMINGLVTPTAGSVTITAANGAEIQSAKTAKAQKEQLDTISDGAAIRRLVGFMFSDPAAQTIMPTVIEDVELSLRKLYKKGPERHEAAQHALKRFGLEAFETRSVHTLSGGQRQMLALASVLATDPQIVVADEPTTLLDLRNSRLIGDVLLGLDQQTIIVTHDLDLAARADRTLVIDNAQVVFDGDPAAAVAWYRENA